MHPYENAYRKYNQLDLKPASSVYEYASKGHVFRCQMYSGRCLGHTKQTLPNGEFARCARRVVRGVGYCRAHLLSQVGLYVAQSLLPGAGDGLFAGRDFAKHEEVTGYKIPPLCATGAQSCSLPYYGEVLPAAEMSRRFGQGNSQYAIDTKYYAKDPAKQAAMDEQDVLIDASCLRGYAAYINHNPAKANLMIVNFAYKEFMGAFPLLLFTKNVREGEELYLDYGAAYKMGDAENTIRSGKIKACRADDCAQPADAGVNKTLDEFPPLTQSRSLPAVNLQAAFRSKLANMFNKDSNETVDEQLRFKYDVLNMLVRTKTVGQLKALFRRYGVTLKAAKKESVDKLREKYAAKLGQSTFKLKNKMLFLGKTRKR